MQSIEIFDYIDVNGHRFLTFDLKDILNLFKRKVIKSDWRFSHIECMGGSACKELEQLSDANVVVAGHKLLNLTQNVSQIVNGCFYGILPGEVIPWIRIDALDSTSYSVTTGDEEIMIVMRKSFKKIRDIVVFGKNLELQTKPTKNVEKKNEKKY